MQRRLPFRAWYYFRMGYITYLSFVIATLNVMVTVYYLAIKNIPQLQIVFPSFAIWAIVITIIGAPVSVALGWLHIKRSPAYRSELDVSVEANPYNYKLPPGYWKEAVAPLLLELLRLNLKLLNKETLTESEKESLKELQGKMERLINGGYLGAHKRMTN